MCSEKTLRIIVIALNIFIIILEIVKVAAELTEEIDYSLIFVIILGLIVCGVALAAIFGSILRKPKILRICAYALIVFLVFVIIAVIISIYAFVTLEDSKREELIATFDKYTENKDDEKYVDELQKMYKCCGVDDSLYWIKMNITIPDSCKGKDNKIYPDGCLSQIVKHTKKTYPVILSISFIIVGLYVAAVSTAFSLSSKLRNPQRDAE
ncbi:unnamed protein product [Acanthoscelides obtectus]|uniref:Tetraspanin n=1 Tax=Acanthoscelides obtectus TaxID=200917 RepID=A0A9P0PVS6_ACAOB|nr:unnamed protein product [Acanthoscelides obtectus]CAK1659661.1 hypothetical protein AOBTE_LOCUS21600 [Acanthoscelides obtectus]